MQSRDGEEMTTLEKDLLKIVVYFSPIMVIFPIVYIIQPTFFIPFYLGLVIWVAYLFIWFKYKGDISKVT